MTSRINKPIPKLERWKNSEKGVDILGQTLLDFCKQGSLEKNNLSNGKFTFFNLFKDCLCNFKDPIFKKKLNFPFSGKFKLTLNS